MRLVHLELRFDFAEEIREYSLAQKMHEAITGKMPKERERHVEEGTLIRSTERKLAVRWDSESVEVTLEEVPNIDNFVRTAIPLLDRINEVAPIRKLRNRTFITNWLLPTPNYDFSRLERKYREIMIAQQHIFEGAFDSSVITDSSISDGILHHQSGAMETKQLFDDYLLFKVEDIPKVFLFLWASIEEKKVVEYSSDEMCNFLAKLFDICKSHSEEFEQIWEGIL